MNISALFIKRPVMTSLVMLVMMLFGILSYLAMPVSSLPNIEFPSIQVSVSYPGASPETISNNVVVPLEQKFSTINGIRSISSTSYTGSATIVLIFELSKDIDLAAPDVQSAINAASSQLPQDLPYAPTYTKANPTATPILFLSLHSDTATRGELYDYAHSLIGQRLNIVKGVSEVQTFGLPHAIRVSLDPQKMATKNIGIDQVASAIKEANVNLPVGTLYGKSKEYSIQCDGQITDAEEYNTLIMKSDDTSGAIVRLKDIGKAYSSVQEDKISVEFIKGKARHPTVGLSIRKEPSANSLETIERINKLLPELEKSLPASIKIYRLYDQSIFIQESVEEVQITLILALILVLVVIFFYLGTLVDTFIPATAIPISVITTFIVMRFLDYNVDIISLLAITLSIGFLVDDAIVVLENIVRHVELGQSPLEAAFKGSKEICFTIISMTLCLCAIFIPLIFMDGVIGKLFQEFGITIVVTILVSGFVSLSLTPLLCSRLIRPKSSRDTQSKISLMSDSLNHFLLKHYSPSLIWALHHKKALLSLGASCVILSAFLLLKLPKDFLPSSDIGLVQAFTVAPNGTSPFEVDDLQNSYGSILSHNPNIDAAILISGSPQDNQGRMYLKLKTKKNSPPTKDIINTLYKEFNNTPGANVFLKPMPLINLEIGTTASKAEYQFVMTSLNAEDLYGCVPILEKKIKALKGFSQITSDLDISQPQLSIHILRDKASMLGISAKQIEQSLQLAFANSNLSPINEPKNQYYVIMEVLPEFYRNPSKLSQLWLTSKTGDLVPLSSVVELKETLGPLTVNHIDGLPSATIAFNLSGIPLQTALEALQETADEILPPTVNGEARGTADIFKSSFQSLTFLLIITLIIIYVILGILYECFFSPIVVMSTLPPAILGGLVSLLICGETLSLYGAVGMIMLLGIVMKNGIIMVDFANEAIKTENMTIHDAIVHSCRVRFRPILMTTFSTLVGALPIAIGIGGAAAESRKSLGIAIVGGLFVSQILTLYLTPVTFTYIKSIKQKTHKNTNILSHLK